MHLDHKRPGYYNGLFQFQKVASKFMLQLDDKLQSILQDTVIYQSE